MGTTREGNLDGKAALVTNIMINIAVCGADHGWKIPSLARRPRRGLWHMPGHARIDDIPAVSGLRFDRSLPAGYNPNSLFIDIF